VIWGKNVFRDETGQAAGIVGAFVDITERKQAEEKIVELQAFSQATIDALSAHLCVLDEKGVIISINQAWRAFAEANPPTPAGHFLGANYLSSCDNARGKDSEEAVAMAQGIRSVMDGSLERFQIEYPCHAPQEERWFVAQVTRFYQNGVVRIAIAHENITERKRAEEKLRESEDRYRTVADFTYDWEYWINPDHQFVYISPACERITGHHADEFIGDPHLLEKITHLEDLPLLSEHLEREFSDEESASIDFRIVTAEGETRWINHVCRSVYGMDGRWLGRRVSNRDITDRKRLEEALRRSEERYRIISGTVTDYAFSTLVDENGEHVMNWVAGAFEAITGYTFEEFAARGGWRASLHPDDVPIDDRARAELLSSGKAVSEVRIFSKSGEIVHLRVYAQALRDEQEGKLTAVYGAVQDITEQKRIEGAARERGEIPGAHRAIAGWHCNFRRAWKYCCLE